MIKCPECESQIDEGQPFCPICGIALLAHAAKESPAAQAEDPFESTIMMSPEELKQHAASLLKAERAISNVASKDQDAINTAEGPIIEIDEHAISSIPFEPAEEPIVDEAAEPQGIVGTKTKGEIEVRQTADYNLNESATSEDIGKDIIAGAGFDPPKESEPPLESFRESNAVPVESILAEPLTEPKAVVKDFAATAVSPPPDPISASEPQTENVGTKKPAESADVADISAPEPQSIAASKPQTENIFDVQTDKTPVESQGIQKPSLDLPLEGFASSNPIFDSVRIIAPPIPESQDFVSTRISSKSRELRDQPSEEAPVAEKHEEAPDTASNIGLVDTDGRKSSKLKPLVEGSILNARYEIVRKIGGGGMGAVYLASDNNLGGVLRAVKEMVQSHIEEAQQEKSINDFKRESMILSSLDHPSIPTIFDYFYDEAEGRFYLVMKYISGGDLSAQLRSAPEGKLDELTVTDLALQVIDVLNYLHNQPSTIVYRDLKPSNIMIDGNSGRVMLIDFGIARSITQKEEKGVTAVGTMGYAPPELFSGNVEPRSDIYSLGSTMFHLLTGADPQSNPLLIFDFQKNPRPRQINPRLSDQMEKILMTAVEYNAAARFGSAAEMQAALEQHLQNLKSGNTTYGVSESPVSLSLEDQFVFCGFCGQKIIATDMFCAFCGAKQPIAQQGVHSEQYSKTSVTAKLFVEGTSELPMPAFSLQKDENLVGRRDPMSNIFPEVDLSKFDPQTKISRRHARIWRSGDKFLLEDLGSSNGTSLVGTGMELTRLAPHKPHQIASGAKIKIGDATLHFIVD
ncbi:MAG: protein kinase domain-containing protein [Pyrinomonadaceae bacterium]